MEIEEASYKDIYALKVNAGSLTALFLPKHGAKMASLEDNNSGREFLAQDPGKTYRKLSYAGDYVAAECSAFDDMFPTCDKYCCNNFPWQGAELPDHGEVCGLPWNWEAENGALHFYVYSPRFGYRLDKWVSARDGKLTIDYKAVNNTPFPFDFLYAAHCMIAAEEGARIETCFGYPAEATLVFDKDKKRGVYGSPFAWKEESGVTPPKTDNSNYKIFFNSPSREGWCSYTYKDGKRLLFRYSANTLPYLGIWFNWGDLHGLYNFAFEPYSGSFDRPDIARLHNQYSVLEPFGSYEWSLAFQAE